MSGLEVRDLKVGDWFEKSDGGICRVELLNDCRARIYVSNVKRKREVGLWGKMEETERSAYHNVSPATPVVRILNETDLRKQSNAEDRGQKGTIMRKQVEKANQIFGLSGSALVCWMGKDGFSLNEALAVFKAKNVTKHPNDNTIKIGLWRGKNGYKNIEPPKLTLDQQKELRDIAKTVIEEKVEDKKTAPKKTKKGKKTSKKSKKSTGLPFSKDKQLGKKTEERIGK